MLKSITNYKITVLLLLYFLGLLSNTLFLLCFSIEYSLIAISWNTKFVIFSVQIKMIIHSFLYHVFFVCVYFIES